MITKELLTIHTNINLDLSELDISSLIWPEKILDSYVVRQWCKFLKSIIKIYYRKMFVIKKDILCYPTDKSLHSSLLSAR